MARIVTVYNTERRAASLQDMSYIRWFKISEALARVGHEVDIATAEFKFRLRQPTVAMGPGLRRVPLSRVRWERYDVVKTLFHLGYETLHRFGGGDHPFVIAKLGSVVGATDLPGIYFHGRQRRALYRVQERLHTGCRYLTLLTRPARDLWVASHGERPGILIVPGAADREVPRPGPDPYPAPERPRFVFAGNLYHRQPEANRALVEKLNALGRRLAGRGRVYVVGPGDVRRLDPRHVTYLGAFPYARSWDHLYHADVGIVVAAGPFMQNNESTKIYHYLRVGLPVVSEAGFPNDDVVREAGLGYVVPNGDAGALAERALEAAGRSWDRAAAVQYVLDHHTWDRRVEVYAEVLARHFGG